MNLLRTIIKHATNNDSTLPPSPEQRLSAWASQNAFVTPDQRAMRNPINEAAARCQIMGPDALLKMLATHDAEIERIADEIDSQQGYV